MKFRLLRRTRLLTLALLFAIVAGSTGVPVAAQEPNVLRVHEVYYPVTLDPHKGSYSQEIAVFNTNYEGLTRTGADGQPAPAAAETWEANDDGSAWTFHLREGLTYSDGAPLTAERFQYAIERTCDPNIAGDYQYVLFDIAGCAEFAGLYSSEAATPVAVDDTAAFDAARAALGVEVVDDRTLTITLNGPAPYFPSIAGLWVMYPVQQELIEQGGEDWWLDPALHVGNGPFQITTIEQDQLISFVANEQYWGGRPKLDGIDFVYVPDASIALEAYRAGDLHTLNPDASLLPAVMADPLLTQEYMSNPSTSTTMFSFNLAMAPFDDLKVREAFAYGLDRDTFCGVVSSGDCVAVSGWVPAGIPGAIETDSFPFDRERARQALAESSYGGPEGLPEIVYSYDSSVPAERTRGEWIATNYFDVLGIEITLEPNDTQTLTERSYDPETYPQFFFIGWVQDYPDPQNWLSLLWTCDGIFGYPAGYCNPEFNALTTEADVLLDMDARLPLYLEAHSILLKDVVGIYYSQANNFLVKPEVSGYVISTSDVEYPGQTLSLTTITLGR